MKKGIAAILIALTTVSTSYASIQSDLADSYVESNTATSAFSDVANVQWAAPSIEFLTSMGIVNGFTDGTFRPDNNITKAEFVKIVISAFGLYNPQAKADLKDNTPSDWYYPYISSALEIGITKPDKDQFYHPNEFISREEMFDITRKAMMFSEISLTQDKEPILFSDNDEITEEYKPSIDYMSAGGMIAGNPDGTLRPKASSTRAEACVMLTRVLNAALENEKNLFEESKDTSEDAENADNVEEQSNE